LVVSIVDVYSINLGVNQHADGTRAILNRNAT
jgi:hypothetical protein